MRSGDIGDEAGRPAGEAGPLDLDAVRADDDLIEALSAGLVPPPSGPRDPSDIEGELVALLAGWVADVRPETLLHRPDEPPISVWAQADGAEDAIEHDLPFTAVSSGTPSLLEHNELPPPVALAAWRSASARPYLLRAAAALVAVALVGSGVIARSYDAHPGEPLWAVTQLAFPAKSHSVEAAISVSTGLNTARVALQQGRIAEARQAFQTVAAQLADVNPDDGRTELGHQMDYVSAQLAATPMTTGTQAAVAPRQAGQPLATGAAGAVIPSSPAVTPGAVAALSIPSIAPSVLAAAPNGTSAGSPAPDANSPAVIAAPDPSAGSVSAPPAPVVTAPPADVASNSAPAVVNEPGNNPVVSAPTTSPQPAPTTDPPAHQPLTDPGTPQATSDPVVDTGTTDPGSPTSDNNPPETTSDNGGGNSIADTQSGAGTQSNADTQSTIDTNGAAGSTLGQVSAVTSTSDSGS